MRDDTYSVKVFVDEKHVVSGGSQGKIRRWRITDDKDARTPGVLFTTLQCHEMESGWSAGREMAW